MSSPPLLKIKELLNPTPLLFNMKAKLIDITSISYELSYMTGIVSDETGSVKFLINFKAFPIKKEDFQIGNDFFFFNCRRIIEMNMIFIEISLENGYLKKDFFIKPNTNDDFSNVLVNEVWRS